MRALKVALLSLLACGGPGPSQPCVPATGPPSFLAGKWHAPVRPSDFEIDLALEGGPAGICGTGHSIFGADYSGGRSLLISGTEQKLLFGGPSGDQSWLDVVRVDDTHVRIGSQIFLRQ